jgi:putative MATE family efflux protein
VKANEEQPMYLDATIDDVLKPAGAKTPIVILPDRPAHADGGASRRHHRLEVLARAKPVTAEHERQSVDAVATAPVGAKQEAMTQRRVLTLATPIIGENLLQTAVGAVDTFMVARLGAAAVAGVGTGSALVFFLISILSAIDIGATILVSQAIGGGDKNRANLLARQAVGWGLILAIPLSLGMFVAAPAVIGLYGAESDVAAAATTYLRVTAAGSAALMLSFVCGAVLRGAGDSRTPLAAGAMANVTNIVVAYALIFGHFGLPELGVAGSAAGAVSGRAVGATFMLMAMARGRKAISIRGSVGWRPHVGTARQLLKLGVPAAVEQVLSVGAFTALMGVVALIGTAALAAEQITFTALSLAFLPAFGFSMAATALVGQSIGARLPADGKAAARIAMRFAVLWMGTGGAVAFLFGERIVSIFTDDPAVVADGVVALRALSIALPFWAIWFVAGGGLRGSGDTRTPLIIGPATMWLSVLIAWVAVRWFGGGLGTVWFSFVLTTSPASLLMWRAFRRRIGDYGQGRREWPVVAAAAH